MRIFNRYVLMLVIVASLVNTVLAFLGQQDIGIYFIFNIVGFLAITFLFTYMNPRARKTLNTVGIVFFSGFVVIVVIEVLSIVSR